jgi:hypothetical protein
MTLHVLRLRLFTFLQRVIFGVLLGLILSLFLIFSVSSFQFLMISSLFGWVLYLVIPLLAGLLTTYRPFFAEEATGLNVGLEVGAISVLLNILTGIIILIIVFTRPSGRLLSMIESLIFVWFLFFHIIGLMLAALGGSLGRAMRKRWISAL